VSIPNCIICGTQKGGTRPLIDFLNQHPDVFMYDREIDFFSWHYGKGWNWYLKHFQDGSERIVGEKSPSYMFTPEVAGRMYENIPDVKLIFLLRDPVDRAYSHYWMNVRRGKEKRSFSSVIREPECVDKYGTWCYISRGMYENKLGRFKSFFPDSQLFVAKSESLRNDTSGVLSRICGFLGISDFDFDVGIKTKVGVRPRSRFVTRVLQTRVCKLCPPVYNRLALYNNISKSYPPMKDEDRVYLEKLYESKSKVYVASES